MLLKPSPVSTRNFSYDKATQTFTAEISDLGKGFSFGRIYDDSCDEGFTLVSQWTGEEVVFVVDREVKDREGDVIGWELRPCPNRNVKKFFKVTLFND